VSALLDQWLDPVRIRQMLENDQALAPAAKLRPFKVVIGPKDCPRLTLDVMAHSSTAAFMQHVGMAQVNERVVVLAEGERS
jgi:hypothetical protein